jgi:hypothetical protein
MEHDLLYSAWACIYCIYIKYLTCKRGENQKLDGGQLLLTVTDKGQTRPLVREGAPQRQDSNFQTTTLGQEVIFGHKSQSGLDTLTY